MCIHDMYVPWRDVQLREVLYIALRHHWCRSSAIHTCSQLSVWCATSYQWLRHGSLVRVSMNMYEYITCISPWYDHVSGANACKSGSYRLFSRRFLVHRNSLSLSLLLAPCRIVSASISAASRGVSWTCTYHTRIWAPLGKNQPFLSFFDFPLIRHNPRALHQQPTSFFFPLLQLHRYFYTSLMRLNIIPLPARQSQYE